MARSGCFAVSPTSARDMPDGVMPDMRRLLLELSLWYDGIVCFRARRGRRKIDYNMWLSNVNYNL